jgi:hypothetical protein
MLDRDVTSGYSSGMEDEYTPEDLHDDMEFLRKAGLIEVIGVNPDGQWLWAATEKSKNMSQEELLRLMEEDQID